MGHSPGRRLATATGGVSRDAAGGDGWDTTGLLTGLHRLDVPPAAGTRFAGNKLYQQRYWSPALFGAVQALRGIAQDEGMDLVTLSYAFVLGHRGVDSVLVGPASLAHLDAALAARQARLSPQGRARVLAVGQALTGTDASYAR